MSVRNTPLIFPTSVLEEQRGVLTRNSIDNAAKAHRGCEQPITSESHLMYNLQRQRSWTYGYSTTEYLCVGWKKSGLFNKGNSVMWVWFSPLRDCLASFECCRLSPNFIEWPWLSVMRGRARKGWARSPEFPPSRLVGVRRGGHSFSSRKHVYNTD